MSALLRILLLWFASLAAALADESPAAGALEVTDEVFGRTRLTCAQP